MTYEHILARLGIDVKEITNPTVRREDFFDMGMRSDQNFKLINQILQTQEKRITRLERLVLNKKINWSLFKEITK